MKIIAGIDPGKQGGVAVMNGDGVYVWPLEWHDDELDLDSLADHLCGVEFVALELVGPVAVFNPKTKRRSYTASNFTFGEGWGQIKAALRAWHIPFVLVPPKTWMKATTGLTKEKKPSVRYCMDKYPALNLKKSKDGLTDALCICEWARQQQRGESQ